MERSIGAIFALTAALLAGTGAPAAELPALHRSPNKPVETPSEAGKGFDIPGSGLHVTFGGYIEGAATAAIPKNAAPALSHPRKPTP